MNRYIPQHMNRYPSQYANRRLIKYTNLYLLLIFLVFYGTLSAQRNGQPLIDSLVAALPAMKEDSGKVRVYARIAATYMRVDPLQGFSYAEKGLQLAENIHWKKGVANLHNNLGLMIGDTGNNKLARVHFEESYALNKELDSKLNLINNLNNIGRSYQRESDYSKAIENYFKALAIAEEIKDNEKLALVATNLTSMFYAQHNYDKANEYGEMALKYGRLAKDSSDIGKALSQLGVIRMETKDSAAAKGFMAGALKVYTEMGDKPQMAQVLTNMASLEYPDYKKAVDILLRAQKIYDETGPSSIGSIGNMGNIGKTYYDLAMHSGQLEKKDYLEKSEQVLLRGLALAKQTDNTEYQGNISLSLANLEEEKGNYKLALQYHKTASAISDSLFSQDKKNEIAGLEGKHTIALKDDEIAINKLRLAGQRKTEIGLIAGLLLAGIIGGLLYWQSRSRKRTNTTLMVLNNQLDEANKIKARFFGILSHDLRGPVANLIHFLHLQKNDPDLLGVDQQALHQQRISQSAENLLTNMESMLLWSKEQMKEFKPQIGKVAVIELFDYIQKFFSQTDQVSITFSQEPGLSVSTDENYLRIIMQNLTSNAIKALKNTTGAAVEWKAWKEGNYTVLSITDNGPGISEEQVKALYEGNLVMNAKSGFGLHLIRDLAKAIQYKISIHSHPGRGTTFTLSAAVS